MHCHALIYVFISASTLNKCMQVHTIEDILIHPRITSLVYRGFAVQNIEMWLISSINGTSCTNLPYRMHTGIKSTRLSKEREKNPDSMD